MAERMLILKKPRLRPARRLLLSLNQRTPIYSYEFKIKIYTNFTNFAPWASTTQVPEKAYRYLSGHLAENPEINYEIN